MKKKRITILILQVGITIVCALLLLSYTQKKLSPVNVYVYNKDFQEIGEEVKEEDIKQTSIPKSAVIEAFATKKEDIVGKKMDTKALSGQYIYKDSLVDEDDLDEFEVMDLSEYRKISLPIDFVDGLSGNIKKGDKLDLIYTGENKDNGEVIYSKAFLQDVLVYSINTDEGYKFKDKSDYYPGDHANEEAEEPQKLGIITLAVTLQQAEEIEARTTAGLVRYAARFAGSEDYETIGFTLDGSDLDGRATTEGVLGKPVEKTEKIEEIEKKEKND